MNIEFFHRPGNAAARIQLEAEESCTAEAGAMISMSPHLAVSTTTHQKSGGGFLKAAKRLLTQESFFLNHFTASTHPGELWVAPYLPGDMTQFDVTERSLIIQGGSYVAGDSRVDLDLSWQGFKSWFSGESLFWMRAAGQGPVLLNSFGAIYEIPVEHEYIVDTGHIVAFEESLSFSISKAGKSWISSFLGGEGLVCRFKGQGTVWCQSHNPLSFGGLLGPLLRPRRR